MTVVPGTILRCMHYRDFSFKQDEAQYMVCWTGRFYAYVDQSELAVMNIYLAKQNGVNLIKNGVI